MLWFRGLFQSGRGGPCPPVCFVMSGCGFCVIFLTEKLGLLSAELPSGINLLWDL